MTPSIEARAPSFLLGVRKAKWVDPQSSIDQPCGTLGGVQCWTAKGEAQKVFEQIEAGIAKLLDDNMDTIEGCQHTQELLGWSMYMRGRDKAHAVPVLVFDCQDRNKREIAASIIKKSKLWRDTVERHPAIRLASRAVVPQACASEPEANSLCDIIEGSGAVYFNESIQHPYGQQIYVNFSKNSSLFRKTTLGGIILVGDVQYGLTAAHAFKQELQREKYPRENNNEFAFEDDSETGDDSSADVIRGDAPPAIRSGSCSDVGSSTGPDVRTAPVSEGNSNKVKISLTVPQDTSLPEAQRPQFAMTLLGHVREISLQYPNNALDWALISIEEQNRCLPNSVSLPVEDEVEIVTIDDIADPEPTGDEIWAITAPSGPVKGRLSTVPYYMKMAGYKSFRKAWTACLEVKVGSGASGTWIISSKTHKLVGQIVAQRPGSELAYIIPASYIQEDIKIRLQGKVTLPVTNDKAELVLQDREVCGAAGEIRGHALERDSKVLGNNHPGKLTMADDLGFELHGQGKYDMAKEVHRRVLEGRKADVERDHSDSLTSVNNLGIVFQSQGKYDAAEEMHRRALEGREIVLGKAPAQAPEYQYNALPDGQSIRMLTLNPGAPNDPLEGHLDFFSVASSGTYEPLSYVWGDPERTHEIICNERRLRITARLNCALRRLRQLDRPRRLWVDQICINQDNQAERSQQVQFMNSIYKNASHVLVWLGPDHKGMAEPAFKLARELVEIFQDEGKCEQFRIDHTGHLGARLGDPWVPLAHVTNLPWFTRAWIVQEIGTRAPATLFWGDAEIDWKLIHIACEKLTDYHHLRKHFNIQTYPIKYVFQPFIAPPMTSRHANRFSLIYELHRARHLQVTDARDRVFAMLGHYSVSRELAALRADDEKTLEQAYVDVAVRAITGDSSLITLAAVQHPKLQSAAEAPNQASGQTQVVDEKTLPSWVPNWESFSERTFAHHAFVTHILSEPISPHCAHGETSPNLKIDESTLVLSVSGVKLDVVKACSEPLMPREFHLGPSDRALAIETLWHDICGKGRFDLEERYINGESAFFAYTQTLSNGCVATSSREPRAYHEIPKSEWRAQGAAYLTKALGQSDDISPELYEVAEDGDYFKWSLAANGATSHRAFARTAEGYFVLGPKVMEVGDVVCVLFGGKMPFCLRPWGRHNLLVGECYVHGVMGGEAMEMLKRGEVAEEVFDVV